MKARNLYSTCNNVEVLTYKSVDEIENIRPIWEQLQASEPEATPNADINRYLSTLGSRGDGVRPHILLLSDKGEPKHMVIGRVEKTQLKYNIGYKTIFNLPVRSLTIVYGGILGAPTKELCALVIKELTEALRRKEADALFFNHLKVDSRIYQFARKVPNVLCRGSFAKLEPHWSMSLPENMDLFYAGCSKKHRANLRRYIRKLEREYSDSFKVVTYTREDELNEAVKAAAEISRETYQYALEGGIVGNSEALDMLTTEARHGWLELSVLFLEGQPCAFQHGYQYKRKYFLEQIGFDPKWRRYNVGKILFLKVLENMCNDQQVDQLDFGFGDAEYKRSYGDKCWHESSIHIFAPRLYPLMLNLLRIAFASISLTLKYIVRSKHSTNWIKRHWRRFLQKSSTN